jgi:hypothetical protein
MSMSMELDLKRHTYTYTYTHTLIFIYIYIYIYILACVTHIIHEFASSYTLQACLQRISSAQVFRFMADMADMADIADIADMADMANLNVYAMAEDASQLIRPCVDCGRYTGNFCENECLPRRWLPKEDWLPNQVTPQCNACEERYGVCHFCRGIAWVTPPPWGHRGFSQ